MLGSLYMVVVLGCSDDLVRCQEIDRSARSWTTAAACERAVDAILASHTDADYPMIAGRCESGDGPRLAGAPAVAGLGG